MKTRVLAKLKSVGRWLNLSVTAWFLTSAGCSIAPKADGVRVQNGGNNLLSDSDLSGFYTWLVDTQYRDPRQVFSVTNQILRISGEGLGYLATEKSYSNYRLIAEFRWSEVNTQWGDRIGKARDSGIFLHAVGPDGNSHDAEGAFMAAIECNVFEGATGDLLLIRGDGADGGLIAPRVTVTTAGSNDVDGWPWWSPGGDHSTIEKWGRVNWKDKDPEWKDETGYRGRRDVELPPGEWNRLEIICRKKEMEVYLNNSLVNRATNVYPNEGKILIQCEGSEIFFRRIELINAD